MFSVLDRENGEPLFPIEEDSGPALTDVPGIKAAPTQPRPVKPLPYARQGIEESDISPLASNKDELLKSLKKSPKRRTMGPTFETRHR
jgi:quinoprotein glucose dehydrogenase